MLSSIPPSSSLGTYCFVPLHIFSTHQSPGFTEASWSAIPLSGMRPKPRTMCSSTLLHQFSTVPLSISERCFLQNQQYMIRANFPRLNLDDTFEHKNDPAKAVEDEVEKAMSAYWYEIGQTIIVDIEPNEHVKRAMNEINAAACFRWPSSSLDTYCFVPLLIYSTDLNLSKLTPRVVWRHLAGSYNRASVVSAELHCQPDLFLIFMNYGMFAELYSEAVLVLLLLSYGIFIELRCMPDLVLVFMSHRMFAESE